MLVQIKVKSLSLSYTKCSHKHTKTNQMVYPKGKPSSYCRLKMFAQYLPPHGPGLTEPHPMDYPPCILPPPSRGPYHPPPLDGWGFPSLEGRRPPSRPLPEEMPLGVHACLFGVHLCLPGMYMSLSGMYMSLSGIHTMDLACHSPSSTVPISTEVSS